MGRVLDVNWEGLRLVGDKFKEQSEEINEIAKQLEKEFNSIHECWKGAPADNFISNSKSVTYNLRREGIYLEIWYKFLTRTSSNYDSNYEDSLSRAKALESEYEIEDLGYDE